MSEKRGYLYDRTNSTTLVSFSSEKDLTKRSLKDREWSPKISILTESRSPIKESGTLQRNFSQEKLKESSQAASVANCIRALNHKNSLLQNENNDLKNELKILNQELTLTREKALKAPDNANIIRNYKEKCMILEKSHEIFQKKLNKCEEVTHLYEALKAEFINVNKELTIEIEKNQALQAENLKVNEEKKFLEKEIEEMNTRISSIKEEFSFRKPHGIKSFQVDEIRLRDYEYNNKLLEEIVEKQQDEINEKRKIIESLKNAVCELENQIYELRRQRVRAENYVSELRESNGKIVRGLKKKSCCRHKAHTPDLMTNNDTSRPQSRMTVISTAMTETYDDEF
ncbi:hypothetical protein SteCoe_6853 [Stentor coeruleus]|uniref:Uncharacterized protein n=1 Tax=Stentor coeruleus TaxID=5963 RepID=A0A1R2CNU1_9CILI|nr:hypothetical protein SteCoe_6853 [Stentor coeruleus]